MVLVIYLPGMLSMHLPAILIRSTSLVHVSCRNKWKLKTYCTKFIGFCLQWSNTVHQKHRVRTLNYR